MYPNRNHLCLCLATATVLVTAILIGGCSVETTDDSSSHKIFCQRLQPGFEIGEQVALAGDSFDSEDFIKPFVAANYIEFVSLEQLLPHRTEHFKYLQSIADEFPSMAVTVVIRDSLWDEVEKAVDDMRQAARLRRSLFVVDSFGVSRQFGFKSDCFGAVLLDSVNQLRFWRCCGMKPSEVKQLADKFAGKPIGELAARDDNLSSIFKPGETVPDFYITSVNDGQERSLGQVARSSRTCFLFTAACTKCEIKSFLGRLKKAEPLLRENAVDAAFCLFEAGMKRAEYKSYCSPAPESPRQTPETWSSRGTIKPRYTPIRTSTSMLPN